MKHLAIVLAGLAIASDAAALSCMRPDPVTDYLTAADADESYVVLLGEFDFSPTRQPAPLKGDPNQARPAAPVDARFSGRSLAANGFTSRFSGTVTLEPVCFAAWCGGFPGTGQALAFVLKEGNSYRLSLSPCPGFIYNNPSADDIARVEACHTSGDCDQP